MRKTKNVILYSHSSPVDPDPRPILRAFAKRRGFAVTSEILDYSPRGPRLRALLKRQPVDTIIVAPSFASLAADWNSLVTILGSNLSVEFYFVREKIKISPSMSALCRLLIEAKRDWKRKRMKENAAYRKFLGHELGRTKTITVATEEKIVELLRSGHSQRDTAKLLGLGKSSVARVKKRHAA